MLKHRLLVSALLIPAIVALFAWDHHLGATAPVLLVVILIVASRTVWEFAVIVRSAGLEVSLPLMLVGTWAMILATWWLRLPWNYLTGPTGSYVKRSNQSLMSALGLVVIALFVNAIARFSKLSESRVGAQPHSPIVTRHLGTLGAELLSIVYVGVLLALTIPLRWVDSGKSGYFALGALVIAAKTGDIGAYTFGRLIGGPKMTPKLSPGKTWAGGIGHVLTSSVCSAMWLSWLGPKVSHDWHAWNFTYALVFGAIVGFAGLLGDLLESLMKRDVGVKDAPHLLPGFGGLLDLMDSILLSGPVAYFSWVLLSHLQSLPWYSID